jgi:AraC-like DNA-binding protein
MSKAKDRTGSPGQILRRYVAANFLILLLPTALALVFYVVSARAISRSVDELALSQLDSGLASLDRAFSDLRRSAARFASDYEINLYLNKTGPLTGIEAYNLKRISDKVAPLVHGSELLSHCFIYFARSGMVAYESGFSRYEDFYGPLFSIEGRGAAEWKDAILSAAAGEVLMPGLRASYNGQPFDAVAALWPLGYGEHNRGEVVAVMDAAMLLRPLERLAASYRGWVAVLDEEGEVISISGGKGAPDVLTGLGGAGGPSVRTLREGGSSYRVYRSASSVTGWSYMAALDESAVLSGARRVRDTALILLALVLVAGSLVSFALASSQAKPLGRLLDLVLGKAPHPRPSGGSVYQRAEEAILALSDSRDKLRAEAMEAEQTARDYFFRRIFEGAYRDRHLFEAEALRFGVDFSGPARYVLLSRMSAPPDARASPQGPPFGPPYGSAAPAQGPGAAGLAPGEYRVPVSMEEIAYILIDSGDRRSSVGRLVEAIRAEVPNEVRAGLSFAAGESVSDAFLLQASYFQAKAALSRHSSGAVEALLYEELPESPGGMRYALDVEESMMKAARSANVQLLASLLESLARSNFDERSLSLPESRDLATGLRLAALRLLPEFPQEAPSLRERLYAKADSAQPRLAFDGAAAALLEMAELAGKRKRGHNRELARQVRAFIEKNYHSPALGLTMVADAQRLSENYLSNLYKEQEGECVSETIERVRIDAAKRLLERGRDSVDAIAAACGYSGGVTFRRAFKRVAGISPSDFRKSGLKGPGAEAPKG